MPLLKQFKKDKLKVEIFDTRSEMGISAAEAVISRLKMLLDEKNTVNMIFAAAPSQNEVLAALSSSDIDWSRVNAYHMDEYIGLGKEAPQGFGNFLSEHLFSKVSFKSVSYLNGEASSPETECERYAALLKLNPPDIVCLGIGENGHIAFNDPWEADFNDPKTVKIVKLDEKCRRQQVNDGCFGKLSDVPRLALTLTIPALTKAAFMFCTVPATTKAEAVEKTVNGEISAQCPASVLRLHDNAILFCDSDSGKYLL